MSLNAAPLNADVVSKGEFTRRRGVSPDRVSQWIDAGLIADLVIVGDPLKTFVSRFHAA